MDEQTQGEWTYKVPATAGYYWSHMPPSEKLSIVYIEDRRIAVLGTDDVLVQELPEQLFWNIPLVEPPMPTFDTERAPRTREQALRQALEDIDTAFAFSVPQLQAHPELLSERYNIMEEIDGERWEPPVDYDAIGTTLKRLRTFAERIEAPRLINAVDLYHSIQKDR